MPGDELVTQSNEVDLTIVDEDLVSAALSEIEKIYHEKYHDTAEAVGRCLLKHFYGNDIENVRKNTPVHGKSLNRLYQSSAVQFAGISKAWLYASINLLVDNIDLIDCEEYQKLSLSHKFQLLRVHDVEKKKFLAKKFCSDNLSVRKSIEARKDYLLEHPEQSETPPTKTPKRKSLSSLIKHPFLLSTPENKEIYSPDSIAKIKQEDRNKLVTDAEKKLEEVEAELEIQKTSKRCLELLLKNLKPAVVESND